MEISVLLRHGSGIRAISRATAGRGIRCGVICAAGRLRLVYNEIRPHGAIGINAQSRSSIGIRQAARHHE